MKKFFSPLLLISVLAISLLLSACDNTTTPSPEKDTTFPSEVGFYWVFQNVLVDATTKVEDPSQKYIDSIYVMNVTNNVLDTVSDFKTIIDVKNEMGLNATVTNKFKYQNKKISSDFSYIFPSQVSIFNTMKSYLGTVNLNDWIVIADYNAKDPWDILPKIQLDSFQLPPMQGVEIKLSNINYKITGAKGVLSPVTFGSTTVSTTEFIITHNVTATARVNGVPFNIPLDVSFVLKYYYAKGYGLVKKVIEPTTVSLAGVGVTKLTDGYNTTLLRYNVK